MGFHDDEASSSSHGLGLSPSVAPLLQNRRKLSSQTKTFANVFIAVVGAGVLGLPYTFMLTGWATGCILLLAVGLLTYHCMMLLVRTRRHIDQRDSKLSPRGGGSIVSFGDLGAAVCGPLGRVAVDAMIVLSQANFCVGYLMYISNTLVHLFPVDLRLSSIPWSIKSVYIVAMVPFQLGLNSIKSLTLLAPLSIFADVVDIAAMGVVLGQEASIWWADRRPVAAFGGASAALYGLGVAVYAFEGIGMVLPLEAEAADKGKFGRTLGLSMGLIAVMYALFGVAGYLAFGDATHDIVTTNLGGGWLSAAVQIGLCVNLYFTMPVMMHPVYEVAERVACGKRYCWMLRWVLVAAVAFTAAAVPNFSDFLSLVGSSVCVMLGFVLPAAFHLKELGGSVGWPGVAADVAVMVVGVSLTVSGTWSALSKMFAFDSA